MKILVATLMMTSGFAFADHTLGRAMNDSAAIRSAVESSLKAAGLVCAVDDSSQIGVPGVNDNSAWRQVALCWSNEAQMKAGLDAIKKEGFLFANISAILDVTYSFKDFRADKLISLRLK